MTVDDTASRHDTQIASIRPCRTAGERMSRELLTTEPAATLAEAARSMAERGVGAVLVAAREQLASILTERDILQAVRGEHETQSASRSG